MQPCGVTRASLVRARAARALSEAAESRRAVADLDGLVQRSCAGLRNRDVELVLSRVRENSSGRPG